MHRNIRVLQYRGTVFAFLVLISTVLPGLTGCNTHSSSSGSGTESTQLTLVASSNTVLLGRTVQLTANEDVSSWTVNGVAGGSGTVGTISSTGLYTAPIILPSSTAVTIGATAAASSATAPLTIDSDVSVTLARASGPTPILTSSTLNLTAAISSAGLPATGVNWTVNGIVNGNAQVGTITPGTNGASVYTAPGVQPSASIQIIATSVADPSKSAAVTQTVQGILLSQTTGTPGSALTLTGNFNTSAPLLVTFSDGMSFQPTISVTPSSTSQTIIIVPLYVTSSGFVQGTVTINAAQQSGSSMLTIGSAPGFIIDALPAATGSTGAVTLAVLKNAYAATAETQNLWTLVGSGSGGSVSTAGITAATSDMQTHLLNLIGSVSQVAGGGSAFMIGTISGSPMQIGTNNLATMDALLEAFYINSPAVQAAISSLPASTLAHLMIPVHGRTPEENLRAFANLSPSSFPSSTGTYLLGVALAVLTAELELPAIAVTAVLYCVIYAIAPEALNQLMKQAAQTIFSNISDLIGMQNAEADITIAQSSISSAGATLSGDYASLDSDLQNLGTLLDPSNPSSPGSEANSDQPTESKNAPPTTASDSTPTLTATGYTVPSTGEILVNVWVQNAPPNIQYSVSTTWGETETVTTDSYGYGFQALVTPVPASGSCYQGTVSLTDSNRNVVASTSGCWGAVTSYAFTMINYPGTQFTSLTGMNDSGQIVGNYGIGGSDCQSFLYSGGTFTTIVYPVSGGDYATCLVGINDSGSMVGEFTSFQSTGGTPPGFSGGFFLYSGGAFTLIEAPFPSGAGAPTGINKSGQIVGCYSGPVISGGVESAVTHGFIYSEGAFTTIDYPGATYYTCPTSINNKGQIVGTYGDSSTDQHGFLYSNGTFTTIDEPGYSGINLNGINDSGVIVGDGDGGAFVYSNGVFTPFSGSGGGAPYMSGILDNGQIVGIINSGTSVQGFVATPSQ